MQPSQQEEPADISSLAAELQRAKGTVSSRRTMLML